ncbi:MAG: acetyl-CoA carboxylase biotin carboxyl carrier protein [Chitinophagaceae bacterium]|nr:acetyl-CoA carboxylase biotin carboxyl carrier protein [Chitinophagaceae bacterium]
MDLKQIQELVKLVNKSNIGELSIEKNDFKITIKQKKEAANNYLPGFTQPQPALAPALTSSLPGQEKKNETPAAEKTDNLLTIKSPMIGTFYRQSGPGKPIFVNVGDEVTSGSVVCIIEAMKLFNEIESEVSGKIVKVLVEDASPVEFDQPLFLVEPD